MSNVSDASGVARGIIANVSRVIIGAQPQIEAAVVCLFAQGNLLVEGVPGVGKTMLARSLAHSIGGMFRRVQATPDLLPSDITGISIYDAGRGEFRFIPGPVFANVVLVDELNRATPRTQSALFEPMEEHQATIDGMPRDLPAPFFLIATQNPVEHHGTFPIPEGQLDRFTMSLELGYPSTDESRSLIGAQIERHPIDEIEPVVAPEEMSDLQDVVRTVNVGPLIVEYVVAIVEATRQHVDVALGASPRAAITLTRCAQARAVVRGRDHVLPDDVKALASAVLAHRLLLRGGQRAGHAAARDLVQRMLREVPVPLGLPEGV